MSLTSFFKQYKSIVFFLILEVMALLSFNFANISEVFYLVAAALCIFAFVFAFFINVEKKDFVKLVPIVAGLFIISGLAAFGGFSHQVSMLSNIATFFALPSFFSLGFFARRLAGAKTDYVIFAIGFGLAAITLISTIITWVEYGPFYATIHKDKPIYFYEGTAYNLTTEMGWLLGFRVTEVAVDYGGLFAILCGTFLPALLFIKPRENKNMFITTAIIGGIGLISILSVPNWKALIFLALASLFAFAYKFLKEKKLAVNIISLVVVIIVGLGIVFYLLTILNAGIGFKFTGIFNRLMCENFIMRPASHTLLGAFAKDINGVPFTLLGFDIYHPAAPLVGEGLASIVYEPTLIFEYEIIKEVGLIGTIFVVAFLIAMFVFAVRYIRDSKDSAFLKNIIIVMLLAFMLYTSFGFNIQSEPHNPIIYNAFLRSVPFMIVLFLFGFIYFVPEKTPEEETQKVEDFNL